MTQSAIPEAINPELSESPEAAREPAARIPGFYQLTIDERRQILRGRAELTEADLQALERGGSDPATADRVVENVVGVYALPLALGLNFVVNGEEVLVPMTVEEPSVVAAASIAARMVREGGGVLADADDLIMTAQIELLGVRDPAAARAAIEGARQELLATAGDTLPRLVARGGGPRGLEVRTGRHPARVIVHVHIDCRNAMGANMVNAIAESLAERRTGDDGSRVGRLEMPRPVGVVGGTLRTHAGARLAQKILGSAARFE